VEDDVRRLRGRFGLGTCDLTKTRKLRVGELQSGKLRHVTRDQARAVDPELALLTRLVLGARHGDARHVEQEARVDAVVADLDALARKHAGIGPFARGFRPVAGAYDVEHARDRLARIGVGDPGRPGDRARLEAFAALGAGVE